MVRSINLGQFYFSRVMSAEHPTIFLSMNFLLLKKLQISFICQS
ncbi:unnamed protein product [Tenebrio molitor]|nr:unnamed protein product [Tenebrio molitor]